MKKILLLMTLFLTMFSAKAQEMQMPSTGQVCNNTEFPAIAKAYHNASGIVTGTFYFERNTSGAFFKETGGAEWTVVVPASSGIYITAIVNSGPGSGGMTVGFRINATGYSPIGGQASTWVYDCLSCGSASFSLAAYPINTVTQFNAYILNAGTVTYKLEPNSSGAFFVATGTDTYTTTAVEGPNSVDVNVGSVEGGFTGNVVDAQGASKCSASSNAYVPEVVEPTPTQPAAKGKKKGLFRLFNIN
jgi:hypothetical protein